MASWIQEKRPSEARCRHTRFRVRSVHRRGGERRQENQHRRHQQGLAGESGGTADRCLGPSVHLRSYPLPWTCGAGKSRIEVLRARTVGGQHRSRSLLGLISGALPVFSATRLTIACAKREVGGCRQAQSRQGAYATIGASTKATIDSSLIRMFIEGPVVSLKGSPTVSPMTAAAWASPPLPSPSR